MHTYEVQHEDGRQTITRRWCNAGGELHRAAGPALEHWTVLPSGVRVLWHQQWLQDGELHRVGRPACREWRVADDGTRVLAHEEWRRRQEWHRIDGPAFRRWTLGALTPAVGWYANDRVHRVDGPALGTPAGWCSFYWNGSRVESGELPWLRRGRVVMLACTGVGGASKPLRRPDDDSATPAWVQDARLTRIAPDPALVFLYNSVVGGAILLCV